MAITHDLRDRRPPLPLATFFVLFALAEGEKHGYRIMQDVRELSSGSVLMGPATLYSTLQRLVEDAVVEELEAPKEERRRTYRLTSAGNEALQVEFRRQADVLALAQRRKLFVPGGRA